MQARYIIWVCRAACAVIFLLGHKKISPYFSYREIVWLILWQYRTILSADAVSEKCKLLSKRRKLCIATTAAVLKPSGVHCAVLP